MGSGIVFTYAGEDDPVTVLDEAVAHHVGGRKGYRQFVDINMDNPWVRVVIFELR